MKKTIKLKRITTADFEAFFQLDSPGFYIAKKAVEHEEVSRAVDVLEVLVLANKLFDSELSNRIATALMPHGKAKAREYLAAFRTQRAADIAVEILGKEQLTRIMRETADFVKQETKVGMGVNDKV
jgi:hypothetical protein